MGSLERIPNEKATELTLLTKELESFVTKVWPYLERDTSKFTTNEKDQVLLANIRLDLEECSHEFFFLYNTLLKLRDNQRFVIKRLDIPNAHKAHNKTGLILTECSIFIKSMYNSFYAIREMLESSQNLKAILKDHNYIELKRVCEFRSKLIVHKQKQKVFTRGARMYFPEELNVTLQIGQYLQRIPQIAHDQCKRLYNQSIINFPSEDKDKTNYYEMSAALYKNLDLVPKEVLKDVKIFIEQYGTKSDPPIVLGKLLLNLLKDYYLFTK